MTYDILLLDTWRNYSGRIKVYQNAIVGLDILAACANELGFSAKVYNAEVNQAAEVIAREVAESGIRMVGIHCHFHNQTEVAGLSRLTKSQWGLTVVVGGPQSVALGADFLSASGADVIVRGEGEETFKELLAYYFEGKGRLSGIKGIVFKDVHDQVVKTPDRDLITDLDALPFPNPENRLSRKSPSMISVITGRGCPFRCSFCYEGHNTKTVRYRSVPNVLAEVEQHLESAGNEQPHYITFNDDTFTLNRTRVLEICRGLKELKGTYDFVWFCEAHAKTIVKWPDIIPVMMDAGLVRMQIGLESGVQAVLDAYCKQVTLEQIETAIRICAENRLPMVYCNVIVGGAMETKETVEETERFVDRLMRIGPGMLDVGTMLFSPYPKTAMSLNPGEFGLKLMDPAGETSMGDYPVAETAALDREEINRLNLWLRSRINASALAVLDKIPREQIHKIFQLAYRHNIRGRWIEVFEGAEHISTYARRVLSGSKSFKDISPEKLPDFRPMRTISFLKKDGNGLSLMRRPLSSLESDFIRYATGKLTIREMGHKLHALHGKATDLNEFYEKLVALVRIFEDRYWISLTEF